ncbi:zinc finger protein 513a isoform X2 [Latimeria chalumnae]|uniref:zinc finger protein 513a isoform X2 n=1 Tax=Latimeria chalumnae TaxID=7897 RepID=UPI0003C12262|nr:PREDICTED: zinc finger protein 513 isoform X2 [Latimeria chalumnae]|eukprot:XP_006006454.1 PREDICTED: zinc finger protein 513 isoform X2 [Latimeria chalumnae]
MPRRKQSNPQPVKYSLVAKIIPSYTLSSDDECSSYKQLSVESETDHPLAPVRGDHGGSDLHLPFCCRQCGLPLDDPTSLDQLCQKCGPASPAAREASPQPGKENGSPKKGRRVHSCKLCSFSSNYPNHLKRHMKTHNGERPYHCGQCSYASAQLVNLQRHVRTHTGEKPFKCQYCSFACRSLDNLKRHARTHTKEKPYACGLCDYRFSQRENLKHHMALHREEAAATFSAEVAAVTERTAPKNGGDEFLSSCARLRSEMEPLILLDAGDKVAEESDTLPELLFPFTCRLCGLVLDDGFTQEEGTAEQICGRCGLEVLSAESPADGAGGGSGSNSPGKGSSKGFSCTLCPFVTHYPNHLARHMKTHSGEKPYKCALCDYASAHFDNLKRHQRVHTGEKPYKCERCDYACGNLANLKRHQRIHSGDKPFKCHLCSYSCNQSMNLKRHMLRHTGEKPFQCPHCPYTTGHWDNYKRHQKIHGHSTEGWTNPLLARATQALQADTPGTVS